MIENKQEKVLYHLKLIWSWLQHKLGYTFQSLKLWLVGT